MDLICKEHFRMLATVWFWCHELMIFKIAHVFYWMDLMNHEKIDANIDILGPI